MDAQIPDAWSLWQINFFMVAPDFSVFSVLNLLQITFTAPESLERLLDFCKIRASLV